MAKGFNTKDTGNIPSAPKNESDSSRKGFPKKTTMNDGAVRETVAKNPKGGT